MLTHKNERPHVCPHCRKDFTRQHDWKRHMELHDPSKKFKCAGFLASGRSWGCNKEFARKDALSRHFKSQQVLPLPSSSIVTVLTFVGSSMYRRSPSRRPNIGRFIRSARHSRPHKWQLIRGHVRRQLVTTTVLEISHKNSYSYTRRDHSMQNIVTTTVQRTLVTKTKSLFVMFAIVSLVSDGRRLLI